MHRKYSIFYSQMSIQHFMNPQVVVKINSSDANSQPNSWRKYYENDKHVNPPSPKWQELHQSQATKLKEIYVDNVLYASKPKHHGIKYQLTQKMPHSRKVWIANILLLWNHQSSRTLPVRHITPLDPQTLVLSASEVKHIQCAKGLQSW